MVIVAAAALFTKDIGSQKSVNMNIGENVNLVHGIGPTVLLTMYELTNYVYTKFLCLNNV